MISSHQPTIFDNSILAAVSSKDDGNMKFRVAGSTEDDSSIISNRAAFLSQIGIEMDDSVLVQITYDRDDYVRMRAVTNTDKGAGMYEPNSTEPADALATRSKGVALFLPLADCVGAIIHDPVKDVIMVSHLGRHSTVQGGAKTNIEFLQT
ncbi:hypothetical protein CYG49_03565, partial [Candidatus Saccharibacteria bacterium]